MIKIHLKTYTQVLDSTKSKFEIHNSLCKQYVFYTKSVDFFAENLHSKVMCVKGDGVNFDYYFSKNVCYADLGLIYHNELDTENIISLKKTIDVIENFINLISIPKNQLDLNSLNNLKSNDGLLISFKSLKECSPIEKEDVIKFFKKNNLNFEVLTQFNHSFDDGASGISEDFIFFITSTLASGISWDIMKFGIQELIRGSQNLVRIDYFENFNFNKLRKKIEDRSKVNAKNLVLVELKRKDSEILVKFMSSNGKIKVITNNKYEIIDYKFKPYSDNDLPK